MIESIFGFSFFFSYTHFKYINISLLQLSDKVIKVLIEKCSFELALFNSYGVISMFHPQRQQEAAFSLLLCFNICAGALDPF